MHPNFAGAMISGALYLLCVFVAGLMTGNKSAWLSAIMALGTTYLSHLVAYVAACKEMADREPLRSRANALVVFSIGVGAGSGLVLLF